MVNRIHKFSFLLLVLLSTQGFSQTAEELFKSGVDKANAGLKTEALTAFNFTILKDPNYTDAYIQRAELQLQVGEYTGMIRDYTKVIELQNGSKTAYLQRGKAYLIIGDNKNAYNDFNTCIGIDSAYALAYTYRGISQNISKDYPAALKDLDIAVTLDSTLALAYTSRGNTKYFLSYEDNAPKGYEDEALSDYNKSIALDDKLAEAYFNRGNFYFYMKDDVVSACPDWTKAAALGNIDAKVIADKNCSQK